MDETSTAQRVTATDGQRAGNRRPLPHFPGVYVTHTPTGGFSMQILGRLEDAGEPLYIVDGIQAVIDPASGIDWFKPEDILQIRVLKDLADTAVYGPAGAKGVILITTKQGMRQRKGTLPPSQNNSGTTREVFLSA